MVTLADLKAALDLASGQIGARTGTVLRVRNRGATLEITTDWPTFVQYFDGDKPDYRARGYVGRIVGGIRWQAADTRSGGDLVYTIGADLNPPNVPE